MTELELKDDEISRLTAAIEAEGYAIVRDAIHLEFREALTATIDVLRAIANGSGPQRSMLALGYAGWAPGQLDAASQANGWLTVAADDDLCFDGHFDGKWAKALNKPGLHTSAPSGAPGPA